MTARSEPETMSPACVAEPVAFQLGDLAVRGDVVLAPMSGYNDQPFRRLCRRFGAAMVYTGLLSANAMVFGPPPWGAKRTAEMLRLHPDEAPLACQIFGSEEAIIVEAARRIEPLNMALIDLNLGCAKPKVTGSGAGAALMRDPVKVGRIFAALSAALDTPVSGKIRLGWDDDSRNYLDVARAMADNGAALIAVHGRTAVQRFTGRADWEAIGEVRRAVPIPVLASGDVKWVTDIVRIREVTGCDGVMVGRAAIGNPWIFQGRDRDSVSWSECLPVIQEHLEMMVAFHGNYHGVHRFRKHLRAYMQGSGIPKRERIRMVQCRDAVQLSTLLTASLELAKTEGDEDDDLRFDDEG